MLFDSSQNYREKFELSTKDIEDLKKSIDFQRSLLRMAQLLADTEKIENGELFLYKCHISPYEQGNRYNHEPERVRKLLLNKKEILKMLGKIKKEGYTIVPLELFLCNGFAKLEIGLAKGKKLHDKREDIAKKSQNRDIERAMKK